MWALFVKEVELLLESGDQTVGNFVVDSLEATQPARVLLIEPDPRSAMWIEEMLRATWPDPLTVAHAERVAGATHELLEEPITCVLLADRDPLTALDQLRTAAPDAPIVLLAEREDEQLALAALSAGAQDYVVKSGLSPALLRRSVTYAIQRKRTEVTLAYQALHDPLTDLPNRALFIDRLGVALDRSRRSGATAAVLFLDVDNFKHVNDSLGHYAGDRLLVELADRLRTLLRPMDTMARFGGDEFTFLFEDLASEREVVTIAERISDAAKLPITLDEGQATITVSIGIAMVADPSIPPDTVIREADAAMYRAKQNGRSRYELFDDASRARAMERLELEAALRQAVERRELAVYYQPSVSLSERFALSGLEALVRWHHPQRGLLAPGEFMAVAEETGLVVAIGRQVVENALALLAQWRQRRPALIVSVNLSSRQLEDTALLSTLSAAIRAAAVEPSKLCLEITENTLARSDDAVRALQALKALGVRLAIDDFGTGASSLTELRRLPIDTIKIHESVIGTLSGDPDEAPIVGAVVELGHALGRSVVAEGVETEAQLAQLRMLGCDGAQGFLFSRPVPEDEVALLLAPASAGGGV